ncbi:MAG: ABC transporter ATP-binding protein [Ruminococcaceae bacterium]|nr:ABC transporter ATP-binding protein [Oscillospiraceae bacterium]
MNFINYIVDTLRSSYKLSKMYIKDNKKLLLMDIFLGFSRECIKIIGIVLPTIIIQAVILEKSINIILLSILIISILTVLLGIVIESIQRNLSNYSLRATNSLYYILNGKSAHLDMKDCEDEQTIDDYYKAFDNIYKFSDVHYSIFCVLISNLLSFVLMSFVIVSIDLVLYLLVLSIHIILMIVSAKQDKIEHKFELQKSESTKRIKYLKELMYNFEAGREMRIYDAGDLVSKKFFDESKTVHKIDLQMQKVDFRFSIFHKLLEIVQLSLIYMISIKEYVLGKVALGNFVMYINATTLISGTISNITNTISFLYKSSIEFKDFNNFLAINETLRTSGNLTSSLSENNVLIEFKNVSYKYPNKDEYALKNISFKIKKGQSISIVGNNGAGKSTLIKLLLRLYDPTEGCILYNGVDIKEYDYDYYQSIFAPVFQDYVMHAYTLRENLIFNHHKNEKFINESLSKTGMNEKIQSVGLDRNYSRRFFNDGIELSGGEEQRIAISRALCKNTEILILDEPTAAIDPLSENKLFKEIFNAVKGKTVIYVSHRMSSTRFSNNILVLNNSQLVESGTHEELLKHNGVYAEMFLQQSSYYS